MDFIAIWRLSWGSVCLGRCSWSPLDLRRYGLICFVSAGFWLFVVGLNRFYTISTIWQIGVGSDRFGNGSVNLIGQFGLVNLIGFVLFLLWIRAVWVNLRGFQQIRLDLCRLGMARGDCGGFRGQIWVDVCWIWKSSMNSCRNGNIFGWVWKKWMALRESDWIWVDFGEFSWIWVQIREDF